MAENEIKEPDAASSVFVTVLALGIAMTLFNLLGVSNWLVAQQCGAQPSRTLQVGAALEYAEYTACSQRAISSGNIGFALLVGVSMWVMLRWWRGRSPQA